MSINLTLYNRNLIGDDLRNSSISYKTDNNTKISIKAVDRYFPHHVLHIGIKFQDNNTSKPYDQELCLYAKQEPGQVGLVENRLVEQNKKNKNQEIGELEAVIESIKGIGSIDVKTINFPHKNDSI